MNLGSQMNHRWVGLMVAAMLLALSIPVRAEVWPPPLPGSPWRSYNPAIRGLTLAPNQPFRMDALMTLAQALSPAVVQVEALLKSGSSQGSGFFLGPEGYLVTNNHVMSRATRAQITLMDGRQRQARLVARDPVTDFALLYVEARGNESFPWLPLGDSDRVEVGQWSAALGAPLRFGNTVTVGIVSSIRRRGSRPKRPNWMKAYIQFDSAINPGSSGGALVNMEGQVIGVVTAMRKDAQGLGFAVPVNRLKRILPRLMGGHNITAATLGVEVQPMDEALARALGLKEPQGALLRDVGRGSPADAIGLVPGDVVLRYGGVTLRDHADLPWLVATSKVGESVELTILRDRQKVSLMAEPVAERRWKLSKAKRTGAEPNPPGGVGVTVASTEVARAIGFEGLSGVLVFQVDANTPAWRAGLRVGMWIAQVGDTPVPSPADFYQAVQDGLARDGAVRIRIYTQERQPQWMAWEAPPGD